MSLKKITVLMFTTSLFACNIWAQGQKKIVCYEVDQNLYSQVRKIASKSQKRQAVRRAIASGSAIKNPRVYKLSSCPLKRQKKLTYIKWLELKQKQKRYRNRMIASNRSSKLRNRRISSKSASQALLNDDVNPFGDLLFAKNEATADYNNGAEDVYKEETLEKDDFLLQPSKSDAYAQESDTEEAAESETLMSDTVEIAPAYGSEETSESYSDETSLGETPLDTITNSEGEKLEEELGTSASSNPLDRPMSFSLALSYDSISEPGFADSVSLPGVQLGFGYEFSINDDFTTMTRPTLSYSKTSGGGEEGLGDVTLFTAKVKQSVYYNVPLSNSVFRPYAGLGLGFGNLTYDQMVQFNADVPGANGVTYSQDVPKEGVFSGMIFEAHLGAEWVMNNNFAPFIELGYRNFNGGKEESQVFYENENINTNVAGLEADQSGVFGVVGVGYRF